MPRIIHIVLWKLAPAPDTTSDTAAYHARITKPFEKLLSIPGVHKGHVGPPKIADRAKGFDWGFYCEFESFDALRKYTVSEEHMNIVINDLRPVTVDSLVYDFEASENL